MIAVLSASVSVSHTSHLECRLFVRSCALLTSLDLKMPAPFEKSQRSMFASIPTRPISDTQWQKQLRNMATDLNSDNIVWKLAFRTKFSTANEASAA